MVYSKRYILILRSPLVAEKFIFEASGGGGGRGGRRTCICCDTRICHYFGYFLGCSRIFGHLFGLFPDFWISFLAIPGFLGTFFLVTFDFFKVGDKSLINT